MKLHCLTFSGALCAFTDTIFDLVDCENLLAVSQRCPTFGGRDIE